MAAKKKTTNKRKASQEDINWISTEVVIILLFAFCVLLFLSNIGLAGAVGRFLRSLILGLFGMLGYLFPVLLFVAVVFYLSNRNSARALCKIGAGAVLFAAADGMIQLFIGLDPSMKAGDYFSARAGGGLTGGLLVSGLESVSGAAGAFVVLLVVIVVAAVYISEKSLVSFVQRRGESAYEFAREDVMRRREERAVRREEQARIREEKQEREKRSRDEMVVRGVDLAGTELKEQTLKHSFAVLGAEKIPPAADRAEGSEGPVSFSPVDTGADAQETVHRADDADETEQAPAAAHPEAPDAADIFKGEIHFGHRGEGEAAIYHAGEERNGEDDVLRRIYLRRDTRTFEEMVDGGSLPEQTAEAADTAPGMQPEQRESAAESESSAPHTKAVESGTAYVHAEEEDVEDLDQEEEYTEDADQPDEDAREVPGPVPTAADIAAAVPKNHARENAAPRPAERSAGACSAMAPVVTASGKILSTDTGMSRALLEEKKAAARAREEAMEEGTDIRAVQADMQKRAAAPPKPYVFPPLSLLKEDEHAGAEMDENYYKGMAIKLQQTLKTFGVGVTVTDISCGPAVTRYELQPDMGVKVSRILALQDDIKLNLAASDIRIEAPIPGKAAIGIEVPNKDQSTVYLRDLLSSQEFIHFKSRLAFAVGKDIGGQTVVTDIAKMPHLLIAGATGSGKSVCINTLIMSILYKAKPSEVRLIMIDPKVVELSVYNGIPHLLIPVVTDPKRAAGALNWAVAEMTERYKKFADCNVRDLKGYNHRIDMMEDIPEEQRPEKLPQIVIIVDELSDLMMVAPQDVEDAICRLAQLARAAGIHLVIATQRPSVNVITGIIKANIPSRIAFAVSSGVDSRTIIDMNGAEKLLGKGDMLFYPAGYPKPKRVQGAFVSDEEVADIVHYLTDQGMSADYSAEIESRIDSVHSVGGSGAAERDEYFEQAGRLVIEKDKASIGMLQRMFKVGFNRAARIMDQLAEAGVVSAEDGTKARQVLMSREAFQAMMEQGE